MTSFIHKDVVDPKICKDIIKFFEKNKKLSTKGVVYNGKFTESIKNSYDLSIPSNHLKYPFDEYQKQLQSCLENYKSIYLELTYNVGKYTIVEPLNIQKYKSGEGFKKSHCERPNIKVANRFLVYMTYLNTVKNGGTYFKYQNYKTDAVSGDTYIWPAEWTHMHSGIGANETKYIITGWYSYDN